LFFATAGFVLVAACGARQENLAILPADDLYARGLAAMEAGDHEEAIVLLDYFVAQHLGDPRAPDARMMLGDAHFARSEYATAATHYMRLVNDFPLHARALEARFKTCDAYFQLSPNPPLDQEYTRSALAHCQSVADYYPGTEEATDALAHVATLRQKLAEKLYNTGVHYFRRREYDSAVVYFKEVVDQFPATSVAPQALEQLVETYTRIGYVEDAAEARERLLRDYPQSPEAQALRA
jgi:outer membrane protein assembly factor BamD